MYEDYLKIHVLYYVGLTWIENTCSKYIYVIYCGLVMFGEATKQNAA